MSDGKLSFQGTYDPAYLRRKITSRPHHDGQPSSLPTNSVVHMVFDIATLRAIENTAETGRIACDLPSR